MVDAPQYPTINREAPNILVTGTPGVGKSTLCKKLAEVTALRWLEISKIAKDNNCLQEYDPEFDTHVLDEDKLMDGLEEVMSIGGNIVDYHSSEFFPERWFDVVFVLTADTSSLYDRLNLRGYSGKKLESNIECEIFKICLDEAKQFYRTQIVHSLESINEAQLEENVQKICQWIQMWLNN
ncbi:hypothetical protein HUJ04_004121 [Dendroctonus ponderosae]